MVYLQSPRVFHSLMVLSRDPDTICRPAHISSVRSSSDWLTWQPCCTHDHILQGYGSNKSGQEVIRVLIIVATLQLALTGTEWMLNRTNISPPAKKFCHSLQNFTCLLSAENATDSTSLVWPRNLQVVAPVCKFHKRSVPSHDPERAN